MLDSIVNSKVGRYSILRFVAETELSKVYEATDGNTRCCLKFLKLSPNQDFSSAQLRFRSEAGVLSLISSPHVVRVYEIGEFQGTYFIALEWVEGKTLREALTEPSHDFVDVIRQIADGLSEVHSKGLLHLDIKPENVILTKSEEGIDLVKIIDFGFAGVVAGPIEGLQGTPQYISPEQAGLVRWPVDVQADLYSLGVVFFELMTGQLPFSDEDPRIILQNQLEKKPLQPSKINSNIHPLVERIILKLLEKNPADRYQSAHGLNIDLQIALHRMRTATSSADLELDQESMRSVRLGKVFVGRREELDFLTGLFKKTYSEVLQVCFVSGSSGMGKTSLLAELQNQMLVAGAHLAYGKCQEFSRGLPFYVIGEALNNFLSKVEHYPKPSQELIYKKLKETVGELKNDLLRISPGFSRILGEATPSKYEGEEQSAQKAKEVIVRVIDSIANRGRPLLLIIDDLQWADHSSLDLISYLIDQKNSGAVFLIGTFRPEEVAEGHPFEKILAKYQAAGGVEKLTLKPLELDEVREMILKSLGKSHETLPGSLLHLIVERTRGNPFFINEILRMLLREKVLSVDTDRFDWDENQAKNLSLPDSITNVVLTRLRELDVADQKLLGCAAILGNPFTAFNLAKILNVEALQIDQMARKLVGENILKASNNGAYLFYHDKVLESCRLLLPDPEQKKVHAQAIQVLESDSPDDNLTFILAEHAIKSGEKGLIIKYVHSAADLAASKKSLKESQQYYECVLQHATDNAEVSSLISLKICDVYIALGAYSEAKKNLEFQLARAGLNLLERVGVLNKIAECLQRQGEYSEALSRLNECLQILRAPLNKKFLKLGILRDRLMTKFDGIRAQFFPGSFDKKRESVLCNTLRRLWMVQVIIDSKSLLHTSYRYLRVANRLGEPIDLANAHQYLALTVSNSREPNFKLGFYHGRRAVEIGQAVGAQEIVAGALIRIAAFLTWQARSREALTYSERAREILLSVGNMWDLGNAIIFSYFSHRTMGQLQEALSSAQSIVKLGERTGSRGLLSSGSSKVAETLFWMNNTEEGEKNLKIAFETAEKFNLKFDLFQALKVAGFSRLHRRQFQDARGFFQRAIKINEENKGSFFTAYIQEAYLGWVETYLQDRVLFQSMLRMKSSDVQQISRYLDEAEIIEKNFRDRGHVWRLRGIFAFRRGQARAGKKFFEKVFKVFASQERPLDLALAEMDWGALLVEAGDAEASLYLKRAHKKLNDLGVTHLAKICASQLLELGENVESSQINDSVAFEKIADTLLDVSLVALSSLNPNEQARALLDKTIEVFEAERALLFLTDGPELPQFMLGRDKNHSDVSQPEGFSQTILSKVQASQAFLVAANTQDGVMLGSHSVIAKNLLSMMAAPILVNDQLMGILYLDNRIERKLYRNEDGRLLQAISSHIGALLKMNRLANLEIEKKYLEKDLEIAAAVQSLLLPNSESMDLERLRVTSYYRPASKTGGDWWWCNVTNAGRFQVFLGDVTGHGAGPAMITAIIAGALRFSGSLLAKNQNYEVLNLLSEGLRQVSRGEYWMTMNIVEIDPEGDMAKLWFAAATNVYILRVNGEHEVLNAKSAPLGANDMSFGQIEVKIGKGDRVVLATDGITEQVCEDNYQIGERRWLKMLKQSSTLQIEEARAKLIDGIHKLRGLVPIADDMCFIIIEIKK